MIVKNGNSMNKKSWMLNIALFIALLFHITGIIGILFTPYKNWFIKNTPLNLLVMAALIIATHPSKNKKFFIFFITAFAIGFFAEVIGVNTGRLFGIYSYGEVLGIKFFNVPLIIGINWFVVIYCVGMITQAYENYMLLKLHAQGMDISIKMKTISFVIDACLLAVLFDWILEPVAVKFGYWQWQHAEIPVYNYLSWLVVSALLLWIFRKLNHGSRNKFAVHLFLIQLLFFLLLRTFL